MNLHEVKRGKKGSVASFIDKAVDKYQEIMVDSYRDWALTIAWTRGFQNVDYDATTKKWKEQDRLKWQARLVTNLMLPVVKSKVAKASIKKPIWDVIPASPDSQDQDISKTSTSLLKHYWKVAEVTKKLIRMLFFRSTTGNGFFKVGWQDGGGKKTTKISTADVDPEIMQIFVEQTGLSVVPEEVEINEGSLLIDTPSPFNMSFDPLVTLFEDQSWVVESQLKSKDWVIENFGTKWREKVEESHDTDRLIHPLMFSTGAEQMMQKGVLIHELFVKPSRLHKNGIYALLANDQPLIAPKDFPLNHGELPYSHFVETVDPLSLWGYCAAQQIRPEQARYNRVKSVVQDHINKVGRIPWVIPQGSVRSISNAPGENIIYKGPRPPEQLKPANLPAYIENSLAISRQDMQDVASFHNVSQAQSEPGLQSGRAIIALQDADEAIDQPTQEWFDESLARTGWLVLKTINQFVIEEQVVQIIGEFGEMETLEYTGAMLQGKSPEGDYFKVRVKTYGRQQMSRAGREGHINTLLQLQILRPREHDEIIREMLDTGYTDMIQEEESVDRTRQFKEIQFIIQNKKAVPVISGENHEIHVKTIRRFLASSRRNKVDAEGLKLIEEHFIQHLQMQAAELVQQQTIIQGALNATGTSGSQRSSGNRAGSQQPSSSGRTGQPTGVNRTA